MPGWKDNPIMEWSVDGGTTWIKVTDHGRSELNVDVEEIGAKQRMANGTMRKYVIAKKRTFSWNWTNLPDRSIVFLANGTTTGDWLEEFNNTVTGEFLMRLRSGGDQDKNVLTRTGTTADSDNERIFTVMISEFSKTVNTRGRSFDLLNISMAVEEV